jgi:hypothetical protein
VHHTGSQEETLVVLPEEQEEPAQEVQGVEELDEEVLEYQDHKPSSFERCKPRSIPLLRFVNPYYYVFL